MRVAHVRISNVLGLTELEFSPTGWTEVSGGNGAGKTSVLAAVRAGLSGGHDASLLRKGAEKGEIVLVLDDGTEIKKRVTAAGSKTTVERGGAVLKSPATVIQQLTDMLSVNPVEFLRAPDKQRVEVLLATMPIEVSVPRLQEITAGVDLNWISGRQGLDRLEEVRRQVFDDRTGLNRAHKEKLATVQQLRAALPADQPPEPPSDQELFAKLADIDAARDAELHRIDAKLAALVEKSQQYQRDLQAQIRALEQQISAEVTELAGIKQKAQASRDYARSEFTHQRFEVEQELAGITRAREVRARYAQTTETIAKLDADAKQLHSQAEACSAALEGLDAYKSELLASLPIPGLEVRDGQIFRDGVAFDRLNTAQQVDVAVEIAKLRAGPLGLICVDGLELLDHAAYDAFRERAEASGLQLVVSRVTDGPLQVQAA